MGLLKRGGEIEVHELRHNMTKKVGEFTHESPRESVYIVGGSISTEESITGGFLIKPPFFEHRLKTWVRLRLMSGSVQMGMGMQIWMPPMIRKRVLTKMIVSVRDEL